MKHSIRTLISVTVIAMAMMGAVGCSRSSEARIEALPCGIDSVNCAFVGADGTVEDLGLHGQLISPLVNGYFTASTPDGVSVYKCEFGGADGVKPVEGLSGLRSAGCMSYGVIPVTRPGGHIELVNGDGETVASLELEHGEITECDPYFTEGVMRITTDAGEVGLVEPSGKIVVEPRFAALGLPSEGRLVALLETETDGALQQHYSVINTEGDELYSFPADVTPVNLSVTDGFVAVRTSSGYAFADVSHGGELYPLPAGVKGVEEVASGMAVVRDAQGKKGLVATDGEVVFNMQFAQMRVTRWGKVAYCNAGKWYVGKVGDEFHEVAGAQIVTPVPLQGDGKGFAFVANMASGPALVGIGGEVHAIPSVMRIDSGSPLLNKVRTDYPRATTTVELPGEEEWTED